MFLLPYMQAALTAAQTALPGVARQMLAGGPEFAAACHQVEVYPGPTRTDRMGDQCAFLTRPQVVVAYSKDCYPAVKVDAGKVTLPDPLEVTAWTTQYATDIAALYDALLDAVMAGQFGGGCTTVTVETANYSGPRGTVCTVRIPLTISDA